MSLTGWSTDSTTPPLAGRPSMGGECVTLFLGYSHTSISVGNNRAVILISPQIHVHQRTFTANIRRSAAVTVGVLNLSLCCEDTHEPALSVYL